MALSPNFLTKVHIFFITGWVFNPILHKLNQPRPRFAMATYRQQVAFKLNLFFAPAGFEAVPKCQNYR
ncbi:MAG: hypothetical protein RL479_1634, partial [Verrucomicrobiota bacterium]